MRKHRGIVWCVGLCALLMLAGCGGNGGGGTGDMQATNEMLNAARAAAMKAYSDAQAALAAVEADKDADMDSYDKAKAQVDAAEAANNKAQTATTVADAEKYRDEAQAAYRDAMKYAGMVTTAADTARETADMARVTELTKAITSTGTRPGGSNLNQNFVLRAGGEIVWDGDTLGTDDEFGAEEFRKASAAAPSIAGWKGAIYSRTVEDEKDELTVYSNAERNTSEAYTTYFNRTAGANARPNVVSAIAGATGGVTGAASASEGTLLLTVPAGGLTDQSQAALDSNVFRKPPTSNVQTITQTAATNVVETSGTFMGLAGHYICEGTADCTVTYDDKGAVTATTGVLTFRPTAGVRRGRILGIIKDADYLTFGYWTQTVTDSSGAMTYGINPFYAGADPYMWGATVPTDLGKATYNGDAAGYYSKLAIAASGVGDPVDAGKFTADVSLAASFEGTTVAVDDQYSITGTVSNFMDDQGEKISDSWSLTLGKTDFSATVVPNTAWTFSGGPTTSPGGKAGTWEGAFYGGDRSATATGTARQPGSVAGSFTGNFLNGHVIGAFGATKQ